MKGRGWKPPCMRPLLFKQLVRMAECEAAGRIAEYNRLYRKLPAETRAVMALLDYVGAYIDVSARWTRRRMNRMTAAQEP